MGGQNEPVPSPVPLPGVPSPIPLPGVLGPAAVQQTTNAQQRAEAARNRINTGDAELGDLGAGTDPDFVRTIEHFEGMTHEAMYEAVHGPGGLDAVGLRTLQRVWFESYSDLVNLSTFNLMGLNRIFGNGLWQGISGDAAQAASTQFSRAANQIGRVFDSVANRLDSLAWSAEAVRAAVQPPLASVTATPNPDNPVESILPGLINPEFDDQARAAREQARQAVIRALNSAYTPAFPPAGAGVPAYTNVPQIGAADGLPVISASQNGSPGNATGVPSNSNVEALQQNPSDPGGTEPVSSEVPKLPPGLGLPEGLRPEPDTTPSNATTLAGLSPAPGTPGLSPGGPGPGTPGGPGSVGLGPGGPGSSIPGAPTSGLPPTMMGTSGPAATRGGMGTPMGPMSPAAGARKKDDEAIHESPGYLRRVHSDWTEGLGGSVGVIGDDQIAGFAHETGTATTDISGMDSVPRRPWVQPDTAVASAYEFDPTPPAEPSVLSQENPVIPHSTHDTGFDRPGLPASGPAEAAERSETVTVDRDPVSTSHLELPRSAENSAAVTVSSAEPMNAERTVDHESQPASQHSVTIAGNGPTMDDPGAAENETQIFTISGTGPIMDEDEGAGR
ncbi:hypothetical protein [Nocardia sp. R6R-6]|uniref:hypothetical protein n=1 Tax=Nocardia sp. R6R-6 TaxID=3459303 RepID=UPI00403D9C61